MEYQWSKPKYWYHITDATNWSDEQTLNPIEHIGYECPYIKRICVAPTVPQCLAAICFWKGKLRVYRTMHKHRAAKAMFVSDQEITDEHWLFEECKFIFLEHIDETLMTILLNKSFNCRGWHHLSDPEIVKNTINNQKQDLALYKRIFTDTGKLKLTRKEICNIYKSCRYQM
jgi:hypothetical protein